ncbi:MAG: hypothetical protein B6U75_04810 [Desulfurococcales archaeon ex4484_217_1]|nr:MAG: hypothetical protein B6U75_04810 [Desulfurococcales archaeon ex4484_217_1]
MGIVKRFERSTIITRSYEYLSEVNNVLGVDVSRKVVAYVIIPKHPYLDVGYRVFRVEVPYEAYEKYENLIFEWIVGDTAYFSTTLPYSLILADTRCKKWSASLLLYLSRLYSEAKIPLTYESRLMVEHVFKEMTLK